MKKVEVTEESIKTAMAAAGDAMIKSLFGNGSGNAEAPVSNASNPSLPITDRVKSFEDACSVLGITPESVLNKGDAKDEVAYKKIKVIVCALNEGWKPDYNDANQAKYYPYFNHSGGGFSYNTWNSHYDHSNVGSRLLLKSSTLVTYSGNQFLDIYKDLQTND